MCPLIFVRKVDLNYSFSSGKELILAPYFSPYFLIHRKLRKSTKMVYNRLEIKNDIAKERRCDFATTLSMRFFVFGLGCTI